MKCSCPKCSAQIDIDEPAVPEKGNFSRCPDCNSRFWTHREPFLMRAYKKEWKAFCDHCGDEVGAASYCQSCYTPFPDYWVVQNSRPIRRRTSYKTEFALSLPSIKLKKSKTVEKLDLEPLTPLDGEPDEKPKSSKKPLLALAAVLLVVGLAFGGINLFSSFQQDSGFNKVYIKTLYGIKSGIDLNFQKLAKISGGQPLSEDEVATLEKVKVKIDKYKVELNAPPERYTGTVNDLNNVYKVYLDVYALTISTSGMGTEFQNQMATVKSNLGRAETRLKNGLPDDLREDISEVTNKYRNLSFAVN